MGYINIKNMWILLPFLLQTIEIGEITFLNIKVPNLIIQKVCKPIKL